MTTSTSRSRMLLALSWLMLSLCACGRQTKFYSDPGALGVLADPPIQIEPTLLPDGFFDESVNSASVDLALDGVDDKSVSLRLRTGSGTNPEGAYNGTGTGNRALLGVSRYSGEKLSAIGSITFDAATYAGAEGVSVLLLTDLNCDGTSIRVLEAEASSLLPGSAAPAGFARLSASFDEPRWRVSGVAIKDPAQSSTTLVPSSSGADAPVALTKLFSKFPNACLRNSSSLDPSLPKNLTTASILFALGTESTTSYNGVFIRRITIGSDIYDYLQWGSK